MKKCPFCAEEIQDAAVKCRHCGTVWVSRSRWPFIVLPLVFVIVLSFFVAREFSRQQRQGAAESSGPLHYSTALQLYAESKTHYDARIRKLRFEEAVREARLSMASEYGALTEEMKDGLREITAAEQEFLVEEKKELYLREARVKIRQWYRTSNREGALHLLRDAVYRYKLAYNLERDPQERLNIEARIEGLEETIRRANNELNTDLFPEFYRR